MSHTSVRVGSRQWKVLCAAEDEYPYSAIAQDLGVALGDGLTWSYHEPIVQSLLSAGLLSHWCPEGEHELAKTCRLRITPRGALARLDRKGRTKARA